MFTLDCQYVCQYGESMGRQAKVVRQIRIDSELWEAAKEAAERNNETISDVLRRQVESYVRKNR